MSFHSGHIILTPSPCSYSSVVCFSKATNTNSIVFDLTHNLPHSRWELYSLQHQGSSCTTSKINIILVVQVWLIWPYQFLSPITLRLNPTRCTWYNNIMWSSLSVTFGRLVVFYANHTNRHDITEILLKVALTP